MVAIKDGTGKGFEAKVNEENQLAVAATTQSEIEHESEENGQAFNWSSGTVDVAAAGTILLVKNTSDTPLHIEYVEIDNGSVASEYTVHLPTTEVTPAGTAVVGTNLNTARTDVAEAIAKSNESDNSIGNVIATRYFAVDRDKRITTPGLILGKNKSLAIDVVENTSESAATIVGHYAD